MLRSVSAGCWSARPPRIRAITFTAQLHHLPYPRWITGLRYLVLARPRTRPSMVFLSVSSQFCAQASSRPPLTGWPLPFASSYRLMEPLGYIDGDPPTGDFHPISYCPCRAYTRRCTGRQFRCAPLPPVSLVVMGARLFAFSWASGLPVGCVPQASFTGSIAFRFVTGLAVSLLAAAGK